MKKKYAIIVFEHARHVRLRAGQYIYENGKGNNMSEIKKAGEPLDQNMTINIRNDEMETLLVRYASEKTVESLNALVNHMHHSRVLVPANLNDKKQPVPCFIRNKEGKLFLPIYTSKTQIPKEPKSPAVLNMPYLAVNQMAVRPELKCDGIVINPFSNNLIFKAELLHKIDEVEKNRKNAQNTGTKTVKMSQREYAVFERKQFEFRFLPKKFFEEGSRFIDTLCEKKEEYIDNLFEESYQQKRLYPYLPEEFSVMAMGISEELLVIRIDMPNRDMDRTSCHRIYLTWSSGEKKGRFFTIEKAEQGNILGEVTSDWKHVNYGVAPVEGAEISRLLELLENEKRQTS